MGGPGYRGAFARVAPRAPCNGICRDVVVTSLIRRLAAPFWLWPDASLVAVRCQALSLPFAWRGHDCCLDAAQRLAPAPRRGAGHPRDHDLGRLRRWRTYRAARG